MGRGARRWAAVVLAGAACGGCAEGLERGGAGPEWLGVTEQQVTTIGSEAPASILGQGAWDPSAAWIRSAFLSNGHALVGYTADGPAAAWAHSPDWMTSSPTWEAHRSDEPPPFGWPAPVNFCKVYDCGGGSAWGAYDSVAQVVWTGLDDVAAVVATGGMPGATTSDVVLVTSLDGGTTFTEARILSTPTAQGDSGGQIVPHTVHASLMYTARRRGAQAGQEAIPIYVVWQAYTSEGLHWFMTRAVVGFDGGIAQPRPPVEVSIIPPSAAAHASILAFEDDNGDEVLHLAWSERTDASGAPSPGPSCPSNQTLHVKWSTSGTRDFGMNWGCWAQPGTQCPPVTFLVHQDTAWRPCVGPSFSESGDAPPYGANNDRPEFVVNRGYPYTLYVAINRSGPGEGMRAAVYRVSGGSGWQEFYVSPSTDPATGAPVEDAWGQSLAILPGKMEIVDAQFTTLGALAMTFRDVSPDGLVSTNAASSIAVFNASGAWDEEGLTTVASKMSGNLGRHSGTAALEICRDDPCPGSAPAVYPEVPFFSAWSEGRIDGATPEIWTRAFTPD